MKRSERLQMLLDNAEKKVAGKTYKPPSPIASLPWNREVEDSNDLQRILAIPRRIWTPEAAQALADEMTPLLAKEGGQQKLRPVQAVALHDLAHNKALICTARVGGGKTLIALLAPYMLRSVRPLLVVPAALKEKTLRDLRQYRRHWEVSEFIRIESYELLARKEQAGLWERYKPDLLIFDEAHMLRNTKAAVVKRLKRYRQEIRPNTPMALLSGTLINRSLRDFWHLFRWTLPPLHCPLPHSYEELDMWAAAVDEKVGPLNRVEPGELLRLCTPEEKKLPPLEAARAGIRRRLVETSGVVTTKETFTGSSLQIAPIKLEPPKEIVDAFKELRRFRLPDGQPLPDNTIVAQHAKQLALGFYYHWDPQPPEEWLKARKEWYAACRKILSHNMRNLDTEGQVREAMEAGYYEKHQEKYQLWKKLEPTFKINTKAAWVSDYAVDAAEEWATKNGGIVWTLHRAFGERLAKNSGIPFYADEGLDADGNFIEDHPAKEPLIASLSANREGKNLQKWNRNLIVNPMSSGKWWEQTIGRTHRDNQPEDTVYVDMFLIVLEHLVSFHKAMGDARMVEQITGQAQKLLYADVLVPSLDEIGDGDLWEAGEYEEDQEEEKKESEK